MKGKNKFIVVMILVLFCVFVGRSTYTYASENDFEQSNGMIQTGNNIFLFGIVSALSNNQVQISVKDESGTDVAFFDIDPENADLGMQAALDYVKNHANNNVLTISIPNGTYYFNDTIKIYSNTCLDLSSGATFKRRSSCLSSLIRFGREKDGDVYGYDAFHDITIKGNKDNYATFDGGGGEKSIVRFAHAKNITFQYLKFTNVTSAHHMEFAGSEDVKIDHCTFDGFKLEKSSDAENYEAIQLDILINKEKHFDHYGAYDNTKNKNIIISNNIFRNVNRGVGTHSGEVGKYFDDVQIISNSFTNTAGYAIVATNYVNSNISNNVLVNCGSGIFFRYMNPNYLNYYPSSSTKLITNSNSVISGNVISINNGNKNASCYGIRTYGETISKNVKVGSVVIPKGNYRVQNITISKNIVRSSNLCNGIWTNGTYGSQIVDNSITYCSNKAITKSAFCDGIKLEKSNNNSIMRNKIVDNSGKYAFVRTGVYITNACSGNVIEDNSIFKATQNGIFEYLSSSCEIRNNEICDSNKHGIYLYNSTATYIDNNEIKKTKNKYSSIRGIYIRGSKSSVNQICDNTIRNCMEHGIMASESCKVKVVENNIITNIPKNAIYTNLSGKISSISSNQISSVKNIGIYINSDIKNMSIYNNAISKVSNYGISIGSGSVAAISQNKISDSKKGAIRIQGNSGKIITPKIVKTHAVKTSKEQLEISWDRINNVTNYIIYRSIKVDGGYKKLATIKEQKFVDKNVKKNQTYYYKVVAKWTCKKVAVTSSYSTPQNGILK